MPKQKSGAGVLALDIGTSSVRAVVYDTAGRMLGPSLTDLRYRVQTDEPGQVSSDPDGLVKLIAQSIDGSLKAARKANVEILAIGVSCYWHSLMGIDRNGRPTTELLTWADTRSAAEAEALRRTTDEHTYHRRTGCFFHASYWPAKLRWLRKTRPAAAKRTARWVSLAEYLYQELFGASPVSLSMASGTGLFDVNGLRWDEPALELSGITESQLSTLSEWDQPARPLRTRFASRWPQLRDLPWYLPLGDGGLANVGADALTPRTSCATIGTSSALRVLLESRALTVPWGTFVYRLDGHRFVLGGALSEGGNVVRWLTSSLGVGRKEIERAAAAIGPDRHGLTVLPFWAGERSPNWRGDARGVLAGLSLSTEPAQLLRASMEAITYQLAAVADAMAHLVPPTDAVIATGGQLVHSAFWSQMLADVLNVRVVVSAEAEASSRGAALLALHALGRLPGLWSMRPRRGHTYRPRPGIHAVYVRARQRQQHLYDAIYPPPAQPQAGLAIAEAESGSRTPDPRNPAATR